MLFTSSKWLPNWFGRLSRVLRRRASSPSQRQKSRWRSRFGLLEHLEDRTLLSGVSDFTIGDASITEGDSGTSFLVFNVTRTGDTSSAVSVSYSTANNSATAGSDYTAVSDILTFGVGVTSATIAIPITGDLLAEPTETFFLNLTGVSHSTGGAASFGTKQDFTTDAQPRAVTLGDLNGDGKLDVAIAVVTQDEVSVFLNTTATGSSTPTFATKVDFQVGDSPFAITMGDLNGDGKPDLAATNFFGTSVSVLFNTTPTGGTTATFATKVDLVTQANPYYVSISDINGDGRPDLVVANQGSRSVSVLLNQTAPGAPTPSFSTKFDFTAGWNPDCVSIGDLNGDGKPDLVVANNYASTLSVMLNTTPTGSATPTFTTHQEFSSFNRIFSTELADFNADGKIDIVTANRDANTVSVLLNTTSTGATTFSYGNRQDYSVGSTPRSIAVRDWNSDGKLDLAVTNSSSNTISVLLNETVPGASRSVFATKQDFAGGSGTFHARAGDMNGDGKPDLVEVNLSGSSFSVLLNTFTSTTSVPMSPRTEFTTGDGTSSVAIGDFNGDGKPDLAVPDRTSSSISVLLNDSVSGSGQAVFLPFQNFTTASGPFSVTVGDFNLDGKPDLVTTNDLSNTISVLLNTTVPGSTTASFRTSQDFPTADGPRDAAIGDINGDGKPDLFVVNSQTNTISSFVNTTAPGSTTASFAARQDFTTDNNPKSIAIGDLNGDGRADVATANSSSNSVSVLFNTTPLASSTLTFGTRQDFNVALAPRSIAIADINGDGRPDLAAPGSTESMLSILMNSTSPGATVPSFSGRHDFSLGLNAFAYSAEFGDFNGDGKPDLAISDNAQNSLTLLINTTVPGAATPTFAARQDTDLGDGRSLAISDLNGDGRLDVAIASRVPDVVAVVLQESSVIVDWQGIGTINTDDLGPTPTIDLNGADGVGTAYVTTFTEDMPAVGITDLDATLTDVDSPQLVNLKLVIGSVPDGANEILTVGGLSIALNANFSGTSTVGATLLQIAYNAGSRTFTITHNSGGTVPIGDFQTLLRGITYANTSNAPNTVARTISFTANDGNADGTSALATINITASNDAPTNIGLSSATIQENLATGTAIGTFSSTDPDAGDTFTYTLVTGTGSGDNSSFSITNGQLKSASAFDFETKPTYQIRVRTTDLGGLSFEKSFTINVNDANDAPSNLTLSETTIAENVSIGTLVGTFSSTDQDPGSSFVYTLVTGMGSNDNTSFLIQSGQLKTAVTLNFEGKPQYTIRVRTTDQGGQFFEKALTVTVTNVNEGPTDVSLGANTIAENAIVGTLVGSLGTIDPDAADIFTYTLISGSGDSDNSSFTIVDGTLRSTTSFNFELKSNYSVRIRATDAGSLSFEKAFAITVVDVNEGPSDVLLNGTSISENQSVGATVGTLTTLDPDSGGVFTYTLIAGDGGTDNALFSIVGNVLRTTASFNYEDQNAYSVRVQSRDQGGLTVERVFAISITDTNEVPTDVLISADGIGEGQPLGTAVGSFSTVDPDSGNTFTYSLVAGSGSLNNSSFTLVNGQLLTNAIFNFETKNSYSIRVRTSDQNGLSFEKQFTINVVNVSEAPTDIGLSPTSILENRPIGTSIGNLTASDPDAGDLFTYELVPGNGDADNTFFTISGNQLQTAAILNFEAQSTYAVRIRVRDLGGLTYEEPFTVTVVNVNEPPVDSTLSSASIAENLPSGTPIGNFSGTDPDVGNTFNYFLVAGAGSTDNLSFSIVNGQLRSATPFNFESKASYSIRVRTTDQGGQAFEKPYTIVVTDVNEAPTEILLSAATLAENQPVGTLIGSFSSQDPDAASSFGYQLVAGAGDTDNASFAAINGELRSAASFDFELKSNYSIRVRSVDQGGLLFEKAITIVVTNVNEDPTDMTLTSTSLSENQPANTVVGMFQATDPDAGDTFAYSLIAGTGAEDNSQFTIVNGQLQSLTSFDFELKNSYSIRVAVADQNGRSFEKPFTVFVTNVNETPSISGIANQSILEDASTGLLAFTIADGESNGVNLTVNVQSSNNALISNAGLVLSGSGSDRGLTVTPNANQSGTAIITLTVSDGNQTSSTTFNLTVTPVNDSPTLTGFETQTILEDGATNALPFTVADIDNSVAGLTVVAVSSNPDLIPNSNLAVSGSGANRNLVVTPQPNQSGSATITVTVSDGTNSSSQVFEVNVQPVDDPTTISSTSEPLVYHVTAKQTVALDAAAALFDPDTPNLVFAGAVLRVSGHAAKDVISIMKVNGIGLKGKKVLFGTTQIGVLAGGKKGTPLTVTLNAAATQGAVQSLLRSVGYKSTDKINGTRNIQIQITNIGGKNTNSTTRQIQVQR